GVARFASDAGLDAEGLASRCPPEGGWELVWAPAARPEPKVAPFADRQKTLEKLAAYERWAAKVRAKESAMPSTFESEVRELLAAAGRPVDQLPARYRVRHDERQVYALTASGSVETLIPNGWALWEGVAAEQAGRQARQRLEEQRREAAVTAA